MRAGHVVVVVPRVELALPVVLEREPSEEVALEARGHQWNQSASHLGGACSVWRRAVESTVERAPQLDERHHQRPGLVVRQWFAGVGTGGQAIAVSVIE